MHAVLLQLGIEVLACGVCSAQGCAPKQTTVPSDAPATREANVAPVLLESIEPTYPVAARARGIEGVVRLRLTVGVDGAVSAVEVLAAPSPELAGAARAAAMQFRFAPARRGGEAVVGEVEHEIVFSLPSAPSSSSIVPDPPSLRREPVPPSEERSGVSEASSGAAPVEAESSSQTRGKREDEEAEQPLRPAPAGEDERLNLIALLGADRQSTMLGEVLARALDEQLRVFIDGFPVEYSWYPFQLANLPVNLFARLEVQRGMVPLRELADAPGGAARLSTRDDEERRAGVTYQVGSFATHRVTADGAYRHPPSGFVAGGHAYFDFTRNDYPIDVLVPDKQGRPYAESVRRFHDGYLAYGGLLTLGVVRRPWARRLLVQPFIGGYERDLQHELWMRLPYGEVRYAERTYGSSVRYEVELPKELDLEVLGHYSYRVLDVSDEAEWVYDWYGERVSPRRQPGERDGYYDGRQSRHSAFVRAFLQWTVAPAHRLRVAVTTSFVRKEGRSRSAVSVGPLSGKRDLWSVVSGLEYELRAWRRLVNVVSVRDYVYGFEKNVSADDVSPGTAHRHHTFGAGDSLRILLTKWLEAVVSYEYAARQPRPDEVFGDGVWIDANEELRPEVSHHLSGGPRVALRNSVAGDWRVETNAFFRDAQQTIFLGTGTRGLGYFNLERARAWGLESHFAWESPGRWVNVYGMVRWHEVRSREEPLRREEFDGTRIPFRPWLYASWRAAVRIGGLPGAEDALEPFYAARYVHGFGLPFSRRVEAELVHDVGVSYTFSRPMGRVGATVQINNVAGAKRYDAFLTQLPGRTFHLMLIGRM